MEEEDLSARIQLCFPATYTSTNPKQITTTYEPECKAPGNCIEDNSLMYCTASEYLISTDFQWNDKKAHTIVLISF
jgi:hypothetical protein